MLSGVIVGTMKLEQHCYASAPVGLKVSRGFQTMARSTGLPEDAVLEPHCAYQRPAGLREAPKMPVNWGWFWLDNDRACLHRIGYAGTDEVGRPGNFMAHNLVVREADLAAVDYDVPALLRWVSLRSPVRYPKSGDDQDGFARNPQHIYEHYSRERPRLGALPPLEVPADEVRELRQQMDAGLEAEVLAPLRDAVKKEVLAGVWRAVVCPADQRKTVLILGAGNGADASALERKVTEWLFALLPAHVRRRLTYSTYEHDPQGLLAPPRPGTKGGPHKERRLYFATTLTDFRPPPGGAVGRVWIINAQTGALQVPQTTTPVADKLHEWLQAGKLDWLREFRDLVSLFPFADEAEGLVDGYRLFAMTRNRQLKREDYPVFVRLSGMEGAPRRPAPALLEIGHRLLDQADEVLGRDVAPKAELAEGFVGLLLRLLPGLGPDERAGLRAGLTQDVTRLFGWGVRPGWEKGLRALLVSFTQEKALEEWRPAAQQALTQALRTSVAPGDMERLLDVWNGVWDGCADPSAEPPLTEIGRALAGKLRQADAANRAQFRRQPEKALLGFVQRLPVADVADLPWRLHLLDEVNAGRSPTLGEMMIAGLVGSGGLTQAQVDQLAAAPTDVILRYYPAWYAAATRDWNRLHGLINNPGHLGVYCQAGVEQQTGMHAGLHCWLTGIRETGQLDDLGRQIATAYLTQHARPLSAALAADTTQRRLAVLTPLGQAHGTLLDFVLHYSEGFDRQQRLLLVVDHLLNLLAYLATQEATASGEGGEPFSAPLRLLARMFSRPATRWDVFQQLLNRLRERRRGVEGIRLPAFAGSRFQAALGSAAATDEAAWYAEYLDQGTRYPDLMGEALTRKACLRLLQKSPDVVDPEMPASEFATFFLTRLMDDEVWRHAVGFVNGGLGDPATARDLARTHRPLLLRLDARGQLTALGDALAERLAPEGNASLKAGLPYLALDLPDSLLTPLRLRLNPVLEDGLRALGAAMREPDRPVQEKDAEQLSQLLQAQRDLGLPASGLTARWQDFLDCFWCLPPQLCGRCFPALYALGEALRQRGKVEAVPFWTHVFHPYLKGASLRFAQTLLACAESLLPSPRDVGRVPPSLKILARLRIEARPLEGGFLGPPDRDGAQTDLLFVALCEFPGSVQNAGLKTEEEVDAVLRRAQVAAAFYRPDEDGARARLAFYLGEDPPRRLPGRDDWDATRVTAIVLLGYLLRQGRNLDDAGFELEELVKSEFPRQLGNLLRKRSAQAMHQCAYWLCQMLCWCEFDEQTADQWSKALWRSMEGKG